MRSAAAPWRAGRVPPVVNRQSEPIMVGTGEFMSARIRKIVTHMEDVLIEGGREASPPLRVCTVAAVVRNPWADQGFVEDLRPAILEVAPELGEALVPRMLDLVGGAEAVEAYGKAAVVGTSGEVEHASAMIHTLRFGNKLREGAGGSSFLPFTNTRGGPGCAVMVPLKHKTEEGTRSHFLTTECFIADAPAPDEIVVAIAGATGGRPHARIGDRYQDMEEMDVDQTGARRS